MNEMNTTDILSKMTLKQKIAQLTQTQLHKDNYDEIYELVKNEAIGSIIIAANLTAGNADRTVITIEQINHLQKIAMENHGIPIIFGHDVIHGHNICLPIPLALSAAFNPELVKEGYECIAEEAKNDGIVVDGKENEVTFGAVALEGGVNLYVEINGTEVVCHVKNKSSTKDSSMTYTDASNKIFL